MSGPPRSRRGWPGTTFLPTPMSGCSTLPTAPRRRRCCRHSSTCRRSPRRCSPSLAPAAASSSAPNGSTPPRTLPGCSNPSSAAPPTPSGSTPPCAPDGNAAAERSRFSILADDGGPFGQSVRHSSGTTRVSVGNASVRTEGPFFRWLDGVWGRPDLRAPEDYPCEFTLGWLGYLGYELKRETGGSDVTAESPDACLLFAGRAVVLDHVERHGLAAGPGHRGRRRLAGDGPRRHRGSLRAGRGSRRQRRQRRRPVAPPAHAARTSPHGTRKSPTNPKSPGPSTRSPRATPTRSA